MDRVDRLVVDLLDDVPDLGGDLHAGLLEDRPGRFTDRTMQSVGDGEKGGRRLVRVADFRSVPRTIMASVGVGKGPPKAAAGPSRSGPMESFPSRNTDDAVASDADRPGSQSPDQGFVAFDRHAEGLEQGDPVGEDGDIRRRAADVEGDGVLAAVGHGQNPHDAGSRTGKDRLDGKFHGLLRCRRFRRRPSGCRSGR